MITDNKHIEKSERVPYNGRYNFRKQANHMIDAFNSIPSFPKNLEALEAQLEKQQKELELRKVALKTYNSRPSNFEQTLNKNSIQRVQDQKSIVKEIKNKYLNPIP